MENLQNEVLMVAGEIVGYIVVACIIVLLIYSIAKYAFEMCKS